MNLVLDDAEEVHLKTKKRRPLGMFTLLQHSDRWMWWFVVDFVMMTLMVVVVIQRWWQQWW